MPVTSRLWTVLDEVPELSKLTMKAMTLVVFLVVIVAVSCRPDKPDLKQIKAEQSRKKACLRDCSSVSLAPVCAGKQGDKVQRSFGNECVMNNYNCENKDTLHKLSDGQCKGSDGIRLS
nr:venom peptide [Acharia stimulea]